MEEKEGQGEQKNDNNIGTDRRTGEVNNDFVRHMKVFWRTAVNQDSNQKTLNYKKIVNCISRGRTEQDPVKKYPRNNLKCCRCLVLL